MARIVVAGAGAIGASIAYHLVLEGGADVVLCDRAQVGAGSTGKAMGGVRQQFSTAPEVRLAQASIRFFEHLGAPFFEQVGYVFLASSEEGLAELEERRALQEGLGVPAKWVDPGAIEGLEVGDVLGAVACWEDGVADPVRVTRELVRQATERGVELVEGVSAAGLEHDVLVVACGPWSADLGQRVGVELPIRPLCRQLVDTAPVVGLPVDLPMVVEAETGFHFRRVDGSLRLAMAEPTLRWGFEEQVDDALVADWLRRLARRYPSAADADGRTCVGRALRHDPGRPSDHRVGARGRLCGVRFLGPRVHAVARGRPSGGSGDPRGCVGVRSDAVPPRPFRRGGRLPREARPLIRASLFRHSPPPPRRNRTEEIRARG